MTREIVCRDAGYDCDFVLRSEDEDELVGFTQEHARNVHEAELSRSDITGVWKTV